MAFVSPGYMTLDRQLFRRSIAEALAELLSQRYRTAKELARGVGVDPSTAENLRKGHLSVTTLEKVLSAEGRALWDKLGDELFGETFYQFEERRLAATIREAENARSNLVRLRSQREKLLAGAGCLDDASLGGTPHADWAGEGGARVEADRGRDAAPQGQRDRTASRLARELPSFAEQRRRT